MKQTVVKCNFCSKDVAKPTKEVNRQLKRGRSNFYCNSSCAGQVLVKNISNVRWDQLKPDNRADHFSCFKPFLNRAKRRTKADSMSRRGFVCDLDLQYLKELWESQSGICPISGLEMNLPINTCKLFIEKNHPYNASLDRIDNDKGYIKGNVRFIVNIANMCRQNWNDEAVINFCNAVSIYGEKLGQESKTGAGYTPHRRS